MIPEYISEGLILGMLIVLIRQQILLNRTTKLLKEFSQEVSKGFERTFEIINMHSDTLATVSRIFEETLLPKKHTEEPKEKDD
jgi:hypothetical protein